MHTFILHYIATVSNYIQFFKIDRRLVKISCILLGLFVLFFAQICYAAIPETYQPAKIIPIDTNRAIEWLVSLDNPDKITGYLIWSKSDLYRDLDHNAYLAELSLPEYVLTEETYIHTSLSYADLVRKTLSGQVHSLGPLMLFIEQDDGYYDLSAKETLPIFLYNELAAYMNDEHINREHMILEQKEPQSWNSLRSSLSDSITPTPGLATPIFGSIMPVSQSMMHIIKTDQYYAEFLITDVTDFRSFDDGDLSHPQLFDNDDQSKQSPGGYKQSHIFTVIDPIDPEQYSRVYVPVVGNSPVFQ